MSDPGPRPTRTRSDFSAWRKAGFPSAVITSLALSFSSLKRQRGDSGVGQHHFGLRVAADADLLLRDPELAEVLPVLLDDQDAHRFSFSALGRQRAPANLLRGVFRPRVPLLLAA